jgi:hypothetical protein
MRLNVVLYIIIYVPISTLTLLLFTGGTAFNGVVEDLKKFTTHVTHVLPVSDDGGSTAEIVRVLGEVYFLIILLRENT